MTGPGEQPPFEDEQARYLMEILGTMLPDEDMDRILPDPVEEIVQGEEEREKLVQSDFEGVPTPYAMQFVAASNTWRKRIATEGATPDLLAEIRQSIGNREARYPGSPLWDRMRGVLAIAFSPVDVEARVDLLCSMRSYHQMIRTILSIEETDNEEPGVHFSAVIERFSEQQDDTRVRDFLQAAYDEAVKSDPTDPTIDGIEMVVRAKDPEYDPLRAWAESEKREYPDADWDGLQRLVGRDEMWGSMSLRERQSVIMLHLSVLDALSEDASPQMVGEVMEAIGAADEIQPARIWDEFRYSFSRRLLDDGVPGAALQFGETIIDSQYKVRLVDYLRDSAAVDEAFELACTIQDAKLLATTLLDEAWWDKGVQKLNEILADESRYVAERIPLALALREIAQSQNEPELVQMLDSLVADLRSHLREQ